MSHVVHEQTELSHCFNESFETMTHLRKTHLSPPTCDEVCQKASE